MAEWIVRLEGDEFDLLDLANHVQATDSSVAKEADGFSLRAAAFQLCSEAQEVLDRANALLPILNGAAAVYVRKYRPVSIGHVIRVDDDGRRHPYVFLAGTIEPRSRVSVQVIRANGAPADEEARDSSVEAALACSTADEAVNRALALYGDLPPTWRNLYIVLEIVVDDVGGEKPLLANNWVPQKKFKLFKWTANSFRALGSEARHGTLKIKKPPETMALTEAQTIVTSILRAWLATKRPQP